MHTLNLKKEWFKPLALLGLSLILTGCSFGLKELPKTTSDWRLISCDLKNSSAPLKISFPEADIEAQFKGTSQALGTAKSLWGNWLRYVVPYTSQAQLFEIEITNKSDLPIRYPLEQIQLEIKHKQISIQANAARQSISLNVLDLDFFKQQWPASAVNTEEQLVDQSRAIGHVIQTIYQPHLVFPGQKQKGILAFRHSDLTSQSKVYLKIADKQACWIPEPNS